MTNTSPETKAPVETEAGAIKVMPQEKPRVESELAVATMISYGNYRIFGAAPRCNVWATGVEYSRHSWGHLL